MAWRRTLLLLLALPAGLAIYAHWPAATLPSDVRADRVEVEKGERLLHLLRGDDVIRSYKVSLGGAPAGHKQQQGDQKTPEGHYRIDGHNPNSRYFLSLHVSYPGPDDRAAAERRGVDPGGDIMIHGLPNGLGWLGRLFKLVDWTAGCIAVTDPEIAEIYRAVPDGTPIDIRA
jgi:murein L,D-transpeptidase YafK